MFSVDHLFLWTAVIGGALFLVQLVLQFIGQAGGGADVDLSGHPGSLDMGHPGADLSFKVLSLQGLTAFLTMFGLVGMALRRESGTPVVLAVFGATAAGVGATWVISRIFRLFGKMQSSGTLDMRRAVGSAGSVYLTVTDKKPGQVQIDVEGRLLTVEATTRSGEPLATGTPIRVVEVLRDNLVMVEPMTASNRQEG